MNLLNRAGDRIAAHERAMQERARDNKRDASGLCGRWKLFRDWAAAHPTLTIEQAVQRLRAEHYGRM